MKPTHVMLNNQHYRYAVYDNPNTDQYGIFLLGALQEIESVSFFSEYFSRYLNVVVIETPGTGMTASLPATVSIIDQASFIRKFLNHFHIAQAHLFVFSYSTAISVELYKMWSGVLSISICGGIPGIPKSGRNGTAALIGDAVKSRSDFSKGFIDILTVDNKSIPKAEIILRAARRKVFKYSEEQINCFIENTLRLLVYKPSYDLSLISVPCLLCIGEHDPYVLEKEALDFISNISDGVLVKIPNADHLTHIQQPEKTAEAMVSSLSSLLNANVMIPAPKEVA